MSHLNKWGCYSLQVGFNGGFINFRNKLHVHEHSLSITSFWTVSVTMWQRDSYCDSVDNFVFSRKIFHGIRVATLCACVFDGNFLCKSILLSEQSAKREKKQTHLRKSSAGYAYLKSQSWVLYFATFSFVVSVQ